MPTTRRGFAAVLAVLAVTACACSAASSRVHTHPGSSSSGSSSPRSSSSGSSSVPRWALTPAATVRRTGELLTRTIPGGASHFVARHAQIYLPPAAVDDPHQRLPVLELLHGTPGGPLNWLDPKEGKLLPTLEAFARAHAGRAPIVVMPDINGTREADTECYRDASGGNVERYLGQIVPAWIAQHLPAVTDHRDWAIAGPSEGGTCSLMLGLRHAGTFHTIGDFSGLAHPSVSDGDDRARTISTLFHGDTNAYDHDDPIWLMTHDEPFTGVGLWLQSGAKERFTPADQALVARYARAAGMTVRTALLPGLGHGWPVWSDAIERMLPWWWQRMSA